MTDRAEIERLLNQTGRTLERLPEDYGDKKLELWNSFRDKTFGHIKSFDMANRILHQFDVIELLVGALRDALDKQPKWISVEERLPPKDTNVLVFATEKIKGFGEAIAICEYSETLTMFGNNTGRYDWSSPWEYFHVDYKITHWMPLPSAPKEGE